MSLTLGLLTTFAWAQEVEPESITLGDDSPVCAADSQEVPVQITLAEATTDNVDVHLLFDDTGSFAGEGPRVAVLFNDVKDNLETQLPGVVFGFGVGRLEDYGGPGNSFSGDSEDARPGILNQPIVTSEDAGGDDARDALITDALQRGAPGFGGDGPETSIEGLFQVATGAGFDGDGNGSMGDSGPAGAEATQTTPGPSGDVPPFSTNVAPSSGSLGGVGFRSGALHLVILATDIGPVSPFPAGSPIPAEITGREGETEPSSAFNAGSRFGFVSDAKDAADNTVTDAVAPADAATVQATLNALNALDVRVIGMGPQAAPTDDPGPSADESVFLSAVARLTGAVDDAGAALVFDTAVSDEELSDAIVNAISTQATEPIDVTLETTALPDGLDFEFNPEVRPEVGPGETAEFTTTITGDGSDIEGDFDINFVNAETGDVLGTIPVSVECAAGEPTPTTTTTITAAPADTTPSTLLVGGPVTTATTLLVGGPVTAPTTPVVGGVVATREPSAAAQPSSGVLPRTGAELRGLAGAALLGIGAGMLLIDRARPRKRRRAYVSPAATRALALLEGALRDTDPGR